MVLTFFQHGIKAEKDTAHADRYQATQSQVQEQALQGE